MAELVQVEGWDHPEPDQLGVPGLDRECGVTRIEAGVVFVARVSREGHWSELVKCTIACPDSRCSTEPASEAGTEGELRGEVVSQASKGLPEADGRFEPEGSSYRGQISAAGWVIFEEPGCCVKQPSRETGVLLLWRVVTLFEQCGVCHTLDSRHGAAIADRIKLKTQGNADWA